MKYTFFAYNYNIMKVIFFNSLLTFILAIPGITNIFYFYFIVDFSHTHNDTYIHVCVEISGLLK